MVEEGTSRLLSRYPVGFDILISFLNCAAIDSIHITHYSIDQLLRGQQRQKGMGSEYDVFLSLIFSGYGLQSWEQIIYPTDDTESKPASASSNKRQPFIRKQRIPI